MSVFFGCWLYLGTLIWLSGKHFDLYRETWQVARNVDAIIA
jgi:hypothetical protein